MLNSNIGDTVRKIFVATVASVGLLACGISSAAVMTFSGITSEQTSMPSYTEAGITAISTSGNNFWGFPSGQQLHLDPSGFNNSSYDFIFGGSPFTVTSVEISFDSEGAVGVWTAYDELNNLIASYNMSASTSHVDSGFAGFAGVYRLHLEDINSHFSIDNLMLDADITGTVPEPFTGALLGIGLMGLLAARRFKA